MPENERKVRYGKCVVEREIGRGARSTVYLAWHEGLQIPVAVKVMKKEYGRDEDQFSERFTREARIAAQLTHTHIVRVYDCGETDEAYYLVLEYIEGESCRDKMEQWGAFDWQRAVQIIRSVADGLRYACNKGIIHRDLKPENIMIDTDGEAHLADLGLAKEMLPGESSTTADGDVLGTPYYMSPEQVRQPGDVEFSSDIYSLGATLYHMATGEVPYEAPTPFEIMTKHLNEPLTPPSKVRPDLPPALCDVIERMMAKEPADRYASYQDLIKALDGLLSGSLEPAEDTDDALLEDLRREIEEQEEEDAAAPYSPAMERAEKLRESAPEGLRALRGVEVPSTELAVLTKLYGLLAVGCYVLTFICLYFMMRTQTAEAGGQSGAWASVISVAAALLVALGYGVALVRGSASKRADNTHTLDDRMSSALGRLCTRFGLPTPLIHPTVRADDMCYAYSFFSRRCVMYVPFKWMHSVGLSEREAEAFMAQGMGPVYSGDSNIRMILGVPLLILRFVHWLGYRLLRFGPVGPRRVKERIARVSGIIGIVLRCLLVALALVLVDRSFALLVGAFFVTLFAVGIYERHMCMLGDYLALKALDDEQPVRNMIVTVGLSGLDTWRNVRAVRLAGLANGWQGDPLPPDRTVALRENLADHFSDVEHVPDTLDTACEAFALRPTVAQRLNRLAGITAGESRLAEVVGLARRLYATMMGVTEKNVATQEELSRMGVFALIGFLAAIVGTTIMFLVDWRQSSGPGDTSEIMGVMLMAYVLVFSVLALVAGTSLVPAATRDGPSPGRVGWAVVLTTLSMCVSATLIFCLLNGNLYSFAPISAVAFVPLLLVVGGAAAFFVRLGPALGLESHAQPQYSTGSKTAHTVMMLLKDETGETTVKPRAKSEKAPGDAADVEDA